MFDLSGSFKVSDESSGDGSNDFVLFHEDGDADQTHLGDTLLNSIKSLLVDENTVVDFVLRLSLRPFLILTIDYLLGALLGVSSLEDSFLALLSTGSWLFSLVISRLPCSLIKVYN